MRRKNKMTSFTPPGIGHETKRNYNSFDIAKFLCSFLVVAIHIAPFGEQTASDFYTNLNFAFQQGICRIAVPLFFIFSGFFLYKKTPANNFSFAPTKKYVCHIALLYLAWTVIYLPISILNIRYFPDGVMAGISLYIKRFFLLGSYIQLWYLNALMVSVLLVSFLLYKKYSPKKILIISAIFYVIGLLGDGYFGVLDAMTRGTFMQGTVNLYFDVFETTRNALFFGFFFISIGMVLANTKRSFSTKKSLALFICSLILLLIEAFTLWHFDISFEHNLLVASVPCAVFCFMFLETLEVKDRKIYKTLRTMSSLIFFGHLWVEYIFSRWIFSAGGDKYFSTAIPFLTTLIVTILCSFVVIKISNVKGFRWVKKLL